ncbi:uncharacterized protein LOC143285145 [Babylonia areolata]|uniref:uncharacterized protein LOC143285145 n=1 Tax=Babylonia areolata TaxID=304850 RepID=UPI003FD46CD6
MLLGYKGRNLRRAGETLNLGQRGLPSLMMALNLSHCLLNRRGVLLVTCVVTMAVCLLFTWSPAWTVQNVWLNTALWLQHAQCPDVMHSMTQGRWERLPMTPSDIQKMNKFHKHVREELHGMPRGLQRKDGLCGNVTFPKRAWFRAMCDTEGDKPCCYHNRCTNRSMDQCVCPECYDMRNPLHAEYARWRPSNQLCQVDEMSVEEICHLLRNTTIFFVGDSFTRHVYTAFLLAVRGNPITGAFSKKTPADLRRRCAGIYMFTEKVCRMWVDKNVRECPDRSAVLRYFPKNHNEDIRQLISQLHHTPRSLAFIGLGGHDKFKDQATFNMVMQPVLQERNDIGSHWPLLVWAPPHRWGKLKSPRDPLQPVIDFSKKMKEHLRPWDVAIFDSLNMTADVESFDGAHYGYGVNKVKAQILLYYLKELQSKKQW